MTPIETSPGMEERNKGELWKRYTQLQYNVKIFENVTMYPQYNNIIIKSNC
jgi:hypothetical protein